MPPPGGQSVTHVSGIRCYLSLRKDIRKLQISDSTSIPRKHWRVAGQPTSRIAPISRPEIWLRVAGCAQNCAYPLTFCLVLRVGKKFDFDQSRAPSGRRVVLVG